MKKNSLKLITLIIILINLVISGCTQKQENKTQKEPISNKISVREHSVLSVIWQQKSSEYKGLCYQAYNIATLQLEKFVAENKNNGKPLAIVTDIDETVLDNSPFNGRLIELDEDYSKELWKEWGKQENAKPLPGAQEFFKFAASQGVEVFYISNRTVDQLPETMTNLKKFNFPFIDSSHFLLKDETSKKQPRRNKVLETHNIIMYLGDNLADFLPEFDELNRAEYLNEMKDKLGFEFIIFPNVMYGYWETKTLYNGKYDWSPAQKDSIRKAAITSFN